MAEKLVCDKCGKLKPEKEFFMYRSGERCERCKDCLTQYIDNRKPDTFKWILEKFDVPYVEKDWVKICNEQYKKNPGTFGPKSVIGRYLRNTLNMVQYKDFRYADSDRLNFANQQSLKSEELQKKQEEEEKVLLRQLEDGEISEAQYNALTVTNVDPKANLKFEMPQLLEEDYWEKQLTDDDIKYLMLKWGTVYTPEEWIRMETMWNQYYNEYEMNVDREEVLKKMCKTSLKMDHALDTEDTSGYKALAGVFDQLRKSGKFTEAQQKEEKQEVLSTIGELVALCEREGGIIEALPQYDPRKYLQDKIDFTLKDLEAYTFNLATKELGLGDLIESYIQKLEESEKSDITDQKLITSTDEAIENEMTDEDYENFSAFLENEIEQEAEELERLLNL